MKFIISFCFVLLFSLVLIDCSQKESSPVSPEETNSLYKGKSPKPGDDDDGGLPTWDLSGDIEGTDVVTFDRKHQDVMSDIVLGPAWGEYAGTVSGHLICLAPVGGGYEIKFYYDFQEVAVNKNKTEWRSTKEIRSYSGESTDGGNTVTFTGPIAILDISDGVGDDGLLPILKELDICDITAVKQ
jgi:hypothetical protein